ncbi:hypothetical protein QX776_04670 [Alteromonadaceae bacterium BrNp21-10]|nr:hypothetical protein [Alteromonadaceae bacterium BrNp21-10]
MSIKPTVGDFGKWLVSDTYVVNVDFSEVPELESYHPEAFGNDEPGTHREKTNIIFEAENDWHLKVILNANNGVRWPESSQKLLEKAKFNPVDDNHMQSQRISIKEVLSGSSLRGWTHVTFSIELEEVADHRIFHSTLTWEKEDEQNNSIQSKISGYSWRG